MLTLKWDIIIYSCLCGLLAINIIMTSITIALSLYNNIQEDIVSMAFNISMIFVCIIAYLKLHFNETITTILFIITYTTQLTFIIIITINKLTNLLTNLTMMDVMVMVNMGHVFVVVLGAFIWNIYKCFQVYRGEYDNINEHYYRSDLIIDI